MKRKINSLFLIYKGKIAVFKWVNEELVALSKEGTKKFDLSQFSWQWYADEMEILAQDELDLCFVWDKEDDVFIKSAYFKPLLEKSAWDKAKILKLLDVLKIDANLTDKPLEKTSFKRDKELLQTNLNLSQLISSKKLNIKKDKKPKTAFDQYFQKKEQQLGGKK